MTYFAIPDALACVQRARAAFRSYLRGTDAWLPVNNIRPTAKVIGGSASEIYERLDYVAQQAFVLYAEKQYLEDHGAPYGITRRPAAPASGNIVVSATDAIAVANGAQFRRSDGVVVTASAAVISNAAGNMTVPVIANTAALATNSQPETPFTILSGVTGSGASSATVAADSNGLRGWLDVEPDGAPRTSDLGTLRGRILFRKRNPPQGGAPADYVQWASKVPGVTRVYVERFYFGPGSVRVFPLFDDLFPTQGGIPDAAHLALVQDAIAAEQPSSTMVTIAAPTPLPISVGISGLEPNTTAVANAIIAELRDAIQRLGQVAGNDPAPPSVQAAMPFLATPFNFAALWIDQAIANATGSRRAVVTAPTADIVIPGGSVPVLRNVRL